MTEYFTYLVILLMIKSAVANGFTTQQGCSVALGIALGSHGLRSPLITRELMLQGAEVIIVAADDDLLFRSQNDANVTQAMLITRGFENVAVVGLANSGGGSAAANWCNGWIPDGGCEGGSALLATASTAITRTDTAMELVRFIIIFIILYD
tara:strand:- start:466 stop:921 length:456 start_codon:yes stop_codon:yes gene_type:complete